MLSPFYWAEPGGLGFGSQAAYHYHHNELSLRRPVNRMRRKLRWGGMVWRLPVAFILALCLLPVASSPVAALSAGDYFSYSYDVEFSKVEINGSELFNATITVTATRNNNDLPLGLPSPSEALITGRIVAEHQATGARVTLNSSYTVGINPFPEKGKTAQESEVVTLQFPEGSQSGSYTVVGELIEARVYVLVAWITVTSYLPSAQTMGSVSYAVPAAGGFAVAPPPAAGEVITNLFGTEASLPISSSGEILEAVEATSEDGMLTLTIPEGTVALDKDANPLLNLEAAVDTSPPPPPEDTTIIGLAYHFGPDGTTFAPPITLTRSYDPASIPDGLAEADLVLAWYDQATGNWVELDGVVDTGNNTITAAIEHFTTFAIIAMLTPAPEPASEPVSESTPEPAPSAASTDIVPITEPEAATTPTPPPASPLLPAKAVNRPAVYAIAAALVVMGSILFFLARRRRSKSSS